MAILLPYCITIILAVFVLEASTCSSSFVGCTEGDGVLTMNDALRNLVVQTLNNRRSLLAKGKYRISNGTLAPSAQNMRKVTYNCSYEQEAQKIASCLTENSSLNDTTGGYFFSFELDKVHTFENTIYSTFQNVATTLGIKAQNGTAVSTGGIQNFAWDRTSQIGCVWVPLPSCRSDRNDGLICVMSPIKITADLYLYTIGSACSSDAQCTMPGVNRCDTDLGLCF